MQARSFFSTTEPALEETTSFGKPEDRLREAENIRLEYTKNKHVDQMPDLTKLATDESSSSPPFVERKPDASPYEEQLEKAVKELNKTDLSYLLNLVLTELRNRESDQIKKDVLTHSKKLRFQFTPEAPTPEPPTETPVSEDGK